MKLLIQAGTTSRAIRVLVQDTSKSDASGLAGLAFGTSGLKWSYIRDDQTTVTVVTPVAATLGDWTSGGFKEVDPTNWPGLYEIGLPDAALASGASVQVLLWGAANMAATAVEIELDAVAANVTEVNGVAPTLSGSVDISSNVKKDQALANYGFVMTDSSTHVPKTGVAVTATRSLDGGAFSACANAPTEVASGSYKINLAASDTNANTIMLRFTGAGADDLLVGLITQP